MLTEKLLLHVLIILAPIFLHIVFFENKHIKHSQYVCGIIQGIAAALCLIFSYESFGLFWDLRYVPLVLAFLYGGRTAGFIVLLFIVSARTYMGGDALVFGYVSVALVAPLPYFLQTYFSSVTVPRKRILLTMLTVLWPGVIQLGILITFLLYEGTLRAEAHSLVLVISLFSIIQLLAAGLAANLNESMIERVLMKQEIRRAEKLNTLGELAASIAHEIRNPLTVVKGFLQLMQRQEKGENYQYLTLVLSELGRAEAIINDYLNFAKPEFKKIESFQYSEAIRDVYLLLQPYALKQGVSLYFQVASDCRLSTDKNQLKQALVNIIKNAVEATPPAGTVSITLQAKESSACLTVQDTGKGMTPEQLGRIGTLFYTTKDKGTGLGTMVSLRIIETMNGKIEYQSEPNKGTEVTVTLPAETAKFQTNV
ncbi:two-component sensor histidine kinase [Bacillus lacus]|uniref:histidine kinase n=1 Tax=Metabacillus lacus TaxID=1983721 RepID=A0A7X2IWN2_9BACI|nr:ATP-binding protein [Metabacillus lacus]MRX71192.1 two-component sensor histidine kinase [Metabacillus lacus]